jgi:hypothetical protein
MTSKLLICVAFLAIILAGCAALNNQVANDLTEHPLDYDGKIVEIVIYPDDSGRKDEYSFCWEACSKVKSRYERIGIGYWPCCYIHSRTPGEYTGWDGNRPVRVRARYDALCNRPNSICPDMISEVFYEVE